MNEPKNPCTHITKAAQITHKFRTNLFLLLLRHFDKMTKKNWKYPPYSKQQQHYDKNIVLMRMNLQCVFFFPFFGRWTCAIIIYWREKPSMQFDGKTVVVHDFNVRFYTSPISFHQLLYGVLCLLTYLRTRLYPVFYPYGLGFL